MKNWARWTLVAIWAIVLILSAPYWNPFTSFPALLKYSVLTLIGAAIFGVLIILAQIYILLSVIFPLPPRADSKAPKSFWKKAFKFAFRDPPINPKAPKTLDELIGNDKAKVEIKEVIDILQNSSHYTESGADVPKGMLFIGPPGVGKTLFARAIANEVGVPFYVVEGSGLSGLIFGLGVLKLKMLFSKLRRHDQAILFIDEIESVGARRQADRGMGAQSDMNMTLNSLLTEMDGFHGSRLLVIGATNNDGMLDPALMRAGRMDRRVYFQLPAEEERERLFRYYLGKVKHADDINFKEIVMLTANYSPADIANVVNEAALLCRRPDGPGIVTTEMIKSALDNIAVGMERMLTSGVELISHDPSVRLDHVIGIDDVKRDVTEIVDFLKRGEDLRKIGATIPKGIMMVGPPGVGKTMLAKAIANEAGVPFFGLSASYFTSMWAGEGAGRIRALYSQARKSPAAIVFIDEIDALGGTVGDTGSQRTNQLNQILVELDGIGRSNVITIGATNMEQSLDPAFMRSGRFDRKLYVGLPDAEARKKIFQSYFTKIALEGEPDLDEIAKLSFNFSGADIKACVNEAAILAVRKGKTKVDMEDLEEAAERISVTAGHKLNTAGINMSKVPDLNVKLEDIKGMEETKAEAAEVVALLKNADLVSKSGLKSPKGILLVGPPGTGKTMLAKAIANEAGVAFYALSGTDFVQVWVGLGAQRVRAVYEQARRSGKPAIVFIDEIDAIGSTRSQDFGGGGQNEVNRTLNQLLVELDGFGKHKVLTIGATNNPRMLDGALLRAGRFDRQIEVPLPNLEGREGILQHYLKKLKLDTTVDPLEIARMTTFTSGADLANIVNEAGLIAIRNGRLELSHTDLIQAVQRVFFGINRSQHIIMRDLWDTAYHEAGHTMVAYFRHELNRIQIVTIVPTGRALGYMWSVAKEDAYHHSPTQKELLVDIEVSLGGYIAEMIKNGQTTAGVSSDLDSVAKTAKRMIRAYGMGPFKFNTDAAYGHMNGAYSDKGSPETEREIELCIKKVVDDSYANVDKLLRSRRAELDKLAAALVEKETLYFRDIVAILEPEKSDADVKRELALLSDRKLVGKRPVIDFDLLSGLATLGKAKVKSSNGSNGSNGSSGSNGSKETQKPDASDSKADSASEQETKQPLIGITEPPTELESDPLGLRTQDEKAKDKDKDKDKEEKEDKPDSSS